MNAEPEDVVAVGEDDQLETRVDVTDELPEESDPYKRRVAVVLAPLGALGAWIGVLHMDSANQESYFARQTTRTAVGSLTANLNKEVAGRCYEATASSVKNSSTPCSSGKSQRF